MAYSCLSSHHVFKENILEVLKREKMGERGGGERKSKGSSDAGSKLHHTSNSAPRGSGSRMTSREGVSGTGGL